MGILFRHIAKTVLQATVLVILVMMTLIFIINFLNELKDIGTSDYGFSQALLHVLLELPNSLYQFFPMIALLGAVFGLGILASNQELVVMRASGFSISQIVLANLSAALLLIACVTLTGEWIAPKAHHLAESQKQSAQNNGQALATVSGVWIHEGNNFLHINRVMGLRHLEGVTRYEFDNQHHMLASYFITSLDLKNKKWVLHDVLKTTFADDKTIVQRIPEALWDLSINPQLLNVGLTEPSAMSLPQLKSYSAHLIKNGLQASDFQFEFWRRIFQPLSTLVMVLLAFPFVLRSSRAVTMGWRVLIAIMMGFTFYIMNAFFGQFSIVFQFSPWLAALFPTLLFAVGAIFFIFKMRN